MNIAEIAKRAKVSTATVSRTLNQSGPVKAATARKVWRAVTALNYYPNSHARALVSGRSRLIGLIVSDITNPFFPELVRTFEGLAAQKQYDLLLTSTNYDTTRMTACLRRMLERKVDGVAMMTSEMDTSLIEELSKRLVPIVFMDVGQIGPRMSHVSIDYDHGVRQAVDHVVGLKHRHVAFISGPLDLHSARTRRQSFVDGLRRHDVRVDPALVREGTHTAEGGEKAMKELLKLRRPPTAVLCSNDWTAIGALHAIRAAGLEVPRDISLVGFDDIPLGRYTTPSLTTVRMSAQDVGATAFEALLSLISEEHVEGAVRQIPTRLVIRESTAAARTHRRAGAPGT